MLIQVFYKVCGIKHLFEIQEPPSLIFNILYMFSSAFFVQPAAAPTHLLNVLGYICNVFVLEILQHFSYI